MSDTTALDDALDTAYTLAHGIGRPEAVKHLRKAIADPEQHHLAEERRSALRTVVAARTVGEVCGCYISKTTLDLLNEALDA